MKYIKTDIQRGIFCRTADLDSKDSLVTKKSGKYDEGSSIAVQGMRLRRENVNAMFKTGLDFFPGSGKKDKDYKRYLADTVKNLHVVCMLNDAHF